MTYDDQQQIGKISKQWTGYANECCTQSRSLFHSVPLDLEMKVKATLLGALFLLEFVLYEAHKNYQLTKTAKTAAVKMVVEH